MTESIIVKGVCQAVTPKAVLIATQNGSLECWYPLRLVRLVAGDIGRGKFAEIAVPVWLYEKSERAAPLRKTSGAEIPADMMRRLIQLCHPDKHGGSETATKATEWLLSNR